MNKKVTKRLLSVMLALTMLFSIGISAFADDESDAQTQSQQEYISLPEAVSQAPEDEMTSLEAVEDAAQEEMSLKAEIGGVITNMNATFQSGEDVSSVGIWQSFVMNADFELPNNQIHQGATIELPETLEFSQTVPFEITDTEGNVVANAVVNSGNKTVTLTYTDYPETHSDVTGSFRFFVRVDHHEVLEETDIPLEFQVEGSTVYGGTIHYEGVGTPTAYDLSKSSWRSSDPQRLSYDISVNRTGKDMRDVIVRDELLTPGITYIKDSIRIQKGQWAIIDGSFDLVNKVTVTGDYEIIWDGDTGFSINLGDIGPDEGFYIRYETQISYVPEEGEIFRNRATITGSNIEEKTVVIPITIYNAGGSAEGYRYTIRLLKQGDDGEPLSGAEFDVVRVRSGVTVGSLITGENGEAELPELLKDDYEIIETKAPDGYVLSGEPITVAPEDFDADKVAFKTVTNEKEKTEISVSKVWVGPELDSVTVELLSGDDPQTASVVAQATLRAQNDWQFTFTDIPVYDSDGNRITYTVSEEAPEGYIFSVQGDAESGFVITNTNVETISIPVTKTWVGPAQESAEVILYADGEELSRATLTQSNNWSFTFTELPKYDWEDGHEITYTLDEIELSGYTTVITGVAQYGFTVTNTVAGKVSVGVTKKWIGPATKSVMITLLADGEKVDEVTLNEDNRWQHTFTDLPEYSGGDKIAYTVQEAEVEGYVGSVIGDMDSGFVVTNTITGKTAIDVKKVWVGNAAQSVTVYLLADGERVDSCTLTARNSWKHTFDGLDAYKDGEEIKYTVEEEPLEGYTSAVTGDMVKGFTVTNTADKTPQKPSAAPKTGDTANILPYLAVIFTASSVLVCFALTRRKRGEK